MKYDPSWDLLSIPDDVWKHYHAIRNGLKGGRPAKLLPCPGCGLMRSAVERRKPCVCGWKQKR